MPILNYAEIRSYDFDYTELVPRMKKDGIDEQDAGSVFGWLIDNEIDLYLDTEVSDSESYGKPEIVE